MTEHTDYQRGSWTMSCRLIDRGVRVALETGLGVGALEYNLGVQGKMLAAYPLSTEPGLSREKGAQDAFEAVLLAGLGDYLKAGGSAEWIHNLVDIEESIKGL